LELFSFIRVGNIYSNHIPLLSSHNRRYATRMNLKSS